MKTPADFEPFILSYAPTIPSEYIEHAVRETVIEFMRDTRIAKATLEFETQEKVPDYMLEVPDCRRIVKVLNVHWTQAHCSGRENWAKLRTGEFAEYEVQLRLGDHPIIILEDPPKKPHKVRVEYVWTIGRDGCDIPDFIYEDFMSAVVAGTCIKLAMLPDQMELKQMLGQFQQTYFNRIQDAKIERTNGKVQRIIGSPFVGGRRRGGIWR